MSKKGTSFTENDLLKKGFIADGKGGFIPSKQAHVTHTGQTMAGNIIVKEKVCQTPDFEAKPPTEWFIKNYSVPSKKNSRQNFVKNGKQVSIPSKAHAAYKKATAMQYHVFGMEFRRSVEFYKLQYPLRVEFTFIRGTQHRADFTNCTDTVQDLMVEMNWIPDDDMLHIIPSFQPREYDKNCPGVKIKLIL